MVKLNYYKLRKILFDRNIKISNVCKEVGLAHSVGTKINKDESIELLTLAKICVYLGIRIEDAVEIEKV